MSQAKRRKHEDIPITINGNLKLVTGVSKYTTCDDVINMVLRKTKIGKENAVTGNFGIYESSKGIERLIPAKSRVLKVIRSWGSDDSYQLVLRKGITTFVSSQMSEAKRRKLVNRRRLVSSNRHMDIVQPQPNAKQKGRKCNSERIGCCCSDNCSEERYSEIDVSRNVTGKSDSEERMICLNSSLNVNVNNVKFAVRKTLKSKQLQSSAFSQDGEANFQREQTIRQTSNSDFAREMCRVLGHHESLAHDISSKVARIKDREGKETLLQKYFEDYLTYRSPQIKYSDSRFREQGDGAEYDPFPLRKGDGSEHCAFSSRGRSNRTLHSNSDSEESVDSGHDENGSDLDIAFINGTPFVSNFTCKSMELSPVAEQNSGDVNVTCVRKLVDYSFTDDSFLTDPSDISSISSSSDNIVHNVSSMSDVVKDVFSENKDFDEDDAMGSFMKSIIYEDLSDEGHCSLGSDHEEQVSV